ncbi:N-acetylglucosamine-6-phosphate deacetylase [Sebaldella termitidis]|uniref:N-acetylglucosamine-6-phosphate deacetylase n=1 Tax=Sebaldella termitidis TaxID=826 RepID=UPI003EBF4558
MVLKNIDIVLEDEVIKSDVQIKNGKIFKISAEIESDESLDCSGKYLIPGFIDMHIHGIGGHDAMDGTVEAVTSMSKEVLKRGVTSYLPTLLTESVERIHSGFEAVKTVMGMDIENTADIIGVHMEGPFFCDEFKGAQNPKFLQYGTLDTLEALVGNYWDILKILSAAPERIEFSVIQKLKEKGVIASIGHTSADSELVEEASLFGMTHCVHLYNGMKGLHHREPGTAGAILNNDRIHAELILDGIHVHPKMAKLAYKCKGNKLSLITDAMRATGLQDGKYDLGGQDVFVKGYEARLANGSLAGSTLTMDRAFKNALKFLDSGIIGAVKLTSTNAADELGLTSKGRIEVGRDADLLVVDREYNIEKIIKAGKIIS